jgi:chromate transport protein ChrA
VSATPQAGVLFVLPSLGILIALTWVYLVYGDVPVVAGILYGIKPAVTAIVVFAAWRIGSRALRNGALWAIAAAAFAAIFALNIPFPYIVLAAGIIGYVGSRVAPDKFMTGGGHGASNKNYGPALIDDHTPTPEHAGFSWSRTLVYSLVGAPMVEATRNDLKFTAPLTGITAAVVGVILNLALFFAWHVLWPQGTDAAPFVGRFEWFSLLVTIAAFLALWRYKIGIIPVIAASALAGLGYSLLV